VGRSFYLYPILFALAIGLTGCELIGDIFKTGVWIGVILVLVILGLIVWIVRAVRKKVR